MASKCFFQERNNGKTKSVTLLELYDYYGDEVFIHYMQQMAKLLPHSSFYISSNESISSRYAELFNIVDKPVDSAIGDLYALSQCDYIIGPPSTFNCWASFIGDVPLYTMFKKGETITLNNFAVMRSEKI